MKIFSLQLLACLTLIWLGTAAEPASQGPWQSLFNGHDLTGWVQVNGGSYVVTNGLIRVEQGKGWLRTERQYTNFVFEAEWRALETNYNSGFYLRAGLPGTPYSTNAWQVNLKQNAVGELLRGSQKIVLAVAPNPTLGEWSKFRMEARGVALAFFVDDRQAWRHEVLDVDYGYLGIALEGKTFEFRNLRVQELP